MIPQSLSASSVAVSEACLARWRAENLHKTPRVSSEPADIGTSVHFALEMFVKAVYLDKVTQWDDVKFLTDMYKIGYTQTFNSSDYATDAYNDGAVLVAKWYDLNKGGLPNTVISCEQKTSFNIKTSIGDVPFNYIWDRFDQIGPTEFEVVDYKTWRKPLGPQDLKKKLQPRAYALAAMIQHPEATKIWVTLDQLRHDGPVGTTFDRDDNAVTYRYLQRAAEKIIDTPEEDAEERLNEECKWCIRKTSCDTLLRAAAGGAAFGLPLDEVVKRKEAIGNALVALKYADEELDKLLVAEGEHRNEFEFEVEGFDIKLTSRGMRRPNSSAIAHIVGPELSVKYGNFTMTNIDKMLKNEHLEDDTRRQVEAQINKSWSEPSAKVTRKVDFEA